MRTVAIRLEGPLQSWGTQSRFEIRDTDREPSKSGVVGLVAAALGIPRDDRRSIVAIAGLEMAVRVDREGTLQRDYHTVGGGSLQGREYGVWERTNPERGDGRIGKTVLTTRHYLADASYLVGLGGSDASLIDSIAVALNSPRWPLFLGRKSCVPSEPPFEGIHDGSPSEVLRRLPIPTRFRELPAPRVRLVVESRTGQPRMDVPVSFALYDRRHRRRFVETSWAVLPVDGTGVDPLIASSGGA